MSTAKDLITLSILVGFGLAVLANANNASKIVNSVSGAWFGLINTVSGTGINRGVAGR